MRILLSAVGSVCITVIAVGFFEAFFSHEQLNIPIKLVLGTIVISAVIGSFSGISPDFDELRIDLSGQVANAEQSTAAGISQLVSGLLNGHGVQNAKIEVSMSKTENDGIKCERITVFSEKCGDKREVESEISELFNAEAEVITNE